MVISLSSDQPASIQSVVSVLDHPNADRLSLVILGNGLQCISAKITTDSGLIPRYKVGDRVLFVTHGSVVPEWLLKKGFWDEEKQKGLLDGPNGNIVRSRQVRGSSTAGILFSVDPYEGYDPDKGFVLTETFKASEGFSFSIGQDVSVLVGITNKP